MAMEQAPNPVLRNLNAMHLQATEIELSVDIADFLILCQIWWEKILSSH